MKEPWLAKLDGPSSEGQAMKVANAADVMLYTCKNRDCDNNVVLLWSGIQNVVYGKVNQKGKSTLIGNPPPAVAAELEKIWKKQFRSAQVVTLDWGKTMLGRFMSYVLALMVPCAMAQTPEQDRQREYYRQLDQQREEQQRRAQEEFQRQQRSTEDARKKTQEQYDDERRSANARPASSSYDARGAADLQALRAKLLRMPPLPDERNTLLGRWRVSDGKPKRKDELGQLMACWLTRRAACQFTFGEGIIEFKSKTWASIDGHGDDLLGPIAYRADGKRLFALPAKGIE